jgi:hypothetical protein
VRSGLHQGHAKGFFKRAGLVDGEDGLLGGDRVELEAHGPGGGLERAGGRRDPHRGAPVLLGDLGGGPAELRGVEPADVAAEQADVPGDRAARARAVDAPGREERDDQGEHGGHGDDEGPAGSA